MEQLNRIELRGSVGSVKGQKVGDKIMARITLATNYAYKDKNGVAVIETTWHNVVAWESRTVTNLDKIDKGCKLYVEGRLRTQRYTGTDNVERVSYEVVANRLIIVEGAEPLNYQYQ